MKIKHKVHIPWDYVPPSHVETNDRYLADLESARRKAEKAWRNAQQALCRTERRLAAKPDPDTQAAQREALRAFEVRERELREIEHLMCAPGIPQPKVAHRTGKDERLELGMPVKPKPKRQQKYPVHMRRR